MVDDIAARRRILLAAQRGRLIKDMTGYMLDRFPRIDLDVTDDARAAAAEGLLDVPLLRPAPWAKEPVGLSDDGQRWLEADDT